MRAARRIRIRAEVSGCVVMQEARSVCSVQYAAHGGDGSALGGARVSGGCSAAVGGGVAEAVAVLFTLGCRLSEPGSGNCHARSAARHSAREHMYSCCSADRGRAPQFIRNHHQCSAPQTKNLHSSPDPYN